MQSNESMVFQVYYGEAYNAIVQPEKPLFYFIHRWLPVLGPTGTSLVLFLRSACMMAADKTGTCELDFAQIGKAIGVGRSTVIRELKIHAADIPAKGIKAGDMVNPALHQFVTKRKVQALTDMGIRHGPNLYTVRMDDPIHDDDMAYYELLVRQQNERKLQTVPADQPVIRDRRTGANAPESPAVQNEPRAKEMPPAVQNEPRALRGKSAPAVQIEPVNTNVVVVNNDLTFNVNGRDRNINPGGGESVAKAPKDLTAALIQRYVSEILRVTSDVNSTRRYFQLIGICEKNMVLSIVDTAIRATEAGVEAGTVPKPGAYLQKIILTKLEGRNIHVPTAKEKQQAPEISSAIRQGLFGNGTDNDPLPDRTAPEDTPGATVAPGKSARKENELEQIARLKAAGGPQWAAWRRFVEETRDKCLEDAKSPVLRKQMTAIFETEDRQRSMWRQWVSKSR